MADAKNVTVGELTGTRRRYSTIHLPERVAQTFGLSADESVIRIEHHDEGISPNEIPFWSAFWKMKSKEAKRKK